MAPAMQVSQRGLRGLYRFTNPESEGQYQARMVQWCFWPTVLHIWSVLFFNVVGLVSFIGRTSDPSKYAWWLIARIGMAVFFLLGVHFSKRCQRHVIPVLCVFIWMELVQSIALMRWRVESWTDESYSYVVPPSSVIYVDGPDGRADVGQRLWGHLAVLAAVRAVRLANTHILSYFIFNMLLGLNWWTLATNLIVLASYTAGLATTPYVPWVALCDGAGMAAVTTLLSVLFSASFEWMQRRHFEAERLLHWELQASQMADSVLNHSLKNTLADIAGNIEMYLAGALPSKALEDCIVSLRRGMRSCKERQAYLQLVAGQYQPVRNAIPLQEFGRQLLAGRHATGRFVDSVVYADYMLLTLIFDNALSNAAKHGDPQNPDVRFSIEEIPADVCRDLPPGKRRFCFQVTNVAHPDRPELTPELVGQLFAGAAQHPSQTRHFTAPTLSDRIGLVHCAMAAKLGGIALSLTQEDDLVTFSGTVDVEVLEAVQAVHCMTLTDTTAVPPAPPLPPGLHFVILEDSLAAQRLLKFHIEQWCAPASITCLGASAGDVPAFMAQALEADVIILDQHLDWDDDPHLGSDLTMQLRRLHHTGFICIRSAEDGPAEQHLYRQAGANCFVGKDLLGPVMVQQLQAAYHKFACQKDEAFDLTSLPLPESASTNVAISTAGTYGALSSPGSQPALQ